MAPTTVAEAITTTVRARKRYREMTTYRGVLLVDAVSGKYTKLVGAERITREDAADDARRAREDWIAVGCLPN